MQFVTLGDVIRNKPTSALFVIAYFKIICGFSIQYYIIMNIVNSNNLILVSLRLKYSLNLIWVTYMQFCWFTCDLTYLSVVRGTCKVKQIFTRGVSYVSFENNNSLFKCCVSQNFVLHSFENRAPDEKSGTCIIVVTFSV